MELERAVLASVELEKLTFKRKKRYSFFQRYIQERGLFLWVCNFAAMRSIRIFCLKEQVTLTVLIPEYRGEYIIAAL